MHFKILGVKGLTYINTKLSKYYILTEFEDTGAFWILSLVCISTECVEQQTVESRVSMKFLTVNDPPLVPDKHPVSFCEKENNKKTQIL